MANPARLTYRDIADLSRWKQVVLWGGIALEDIAYAPIGVSLMQAVSMDAAALEVLDRHNEYWHAHKEVTQ